MYINDSIRSGGPTRSSADFSVPRPRTHDDRTGRVFPDHLITTQSHLRRTYCTQQPLPCHTCMLKRGSVDLGPTTHVATLDTHWLHAHTPTQGNTTSTIRKQRQVHVRPVSSILSYSTSPASQRCSPACAVRGLVGVCGLGAATSQALISFHIDGASYLEHTRCASLCSSYNSSQHGDAVHS